jgi:hypothetical protein
MMMIIMMIWRAKVHILVCIIISCPEWFDINYTQMVSPVYQKMTNLIVGFPIWGYPRMFMNVEMQEHGTFDRVFICGNVYYSIIINNFV